MNDLMGKILRGRDHKGRQFTGEVIAATETHVTLKNKRGRLAVSRIDDCCDTSRACPTFIAHGPNKIQVIKVIRKHSRFDLARAKAFSERAGWPLYEAFGAYSAEMISAFRDDLVANGAIVETR